MNKKDQKIKELETEISGLKSSVKELKVLNDIALSSGRTIDIDHVLNLIVQKCVQVIEAEQCSISLTTGNENKPFKTIVRQDNTSSLKHDYHINSNITGWVLLNKKPLIIEDLSRDRRFNPSEEEKKDIHSILCVPIWYEGIIIGIMMLINKKNREQFLKSDLTLFTIVSVQAGQIIKNLQLQKEKFQKIKETEKLQELDKLKTNFFTNISHEFRTPLTLILGPSKQILDKIKDDNIKEEVKIIYRSARKLNRLADQLLDISRIEAGQMKLRTCRQNLVSVIKEITYTFQSFAEAKNISLNFNTDRDEIIIFLDKDNIDKIVSNLLSNALKFTPPEGYVDVGVRKEKDVAEVVVADTGIGIPKDHLSKIFNRFYQVDNKLSKEYEGIGIGLSLTKELVELHKAKIIVESEEGKGSTFRIILPLGNEHLLPEEIFERTLHTNQNKYENKIDKIPEEEFTMIENVNTKKYNIESMQEESLPVLLIIEDNSTLRSYISNIVKEKFKTVEAVNGEDGLCKSFEFIPDIIISDVMMPKMDGFQLCNKLKTDFRTSHIPVILLTAKATLKDKIYGLETGADDYIMKPFEATELKARIKNLLEQRRRLHKHFEKFGFIGIDENYISSMDQKFLCKVIEIINENISNPSFSVEMFAENLATSRSLLHKKLSALVGEPPGELIKRFRLNKAAGILENKSCNVTETAFEVGFNDPSYFAVCFKKQFGISPSQYHQRKQVES